MTKHPITLHCRKYLHIYQQFECTRTLLEIISSSTVRRYQSISCDFALQKILLHLSTDRMHANITRDRIFPTNVNRSVTDQQVSRRYKSPP
ncbi:hypothetical protein GIB67_032012 [Kingdonia uniflora]|uniref:Uncharacterized protein n=1 Tax=Kingdonia uniflora TaxID=39325 RepID=A0A7J7MWD3_9MAGN|nr:hypothetical protein GIB67_032012 [Kingdonia uniflora]